MKCEAEGPLQFKNETSFHEMKCILFSLLSMGIC